MCAVYFAAPGGTSFERYGVLDCACPLFCLMRLLLRHTWILFATVKSTRKSFLPLTHSLHVRHLQGYAVCFGVFFYCPPFFIPISDQDITTHNHPPPAPSFPSSLIPPFNSHPNATPADALRSSLLISKGPRSLSLHPVKRQLTEPLCRQRRRRYGL